jgi:hypothetical protein
MNYTDEFQSAIIDAVNHAAKHNVHPAIVYTVLGGVQSDVLLAIKQSNRLAQAAAPTPPSQPSTLNPQPPNNVIPLPKTDSVN